MMDGSGKHNTHTYTGRHRYRHTYKHPHTQTRSHTIKHTHRHTHTHTHAHTHAQHTCTPPMQLREESEGDTANRFCRKGEEVAQEGLCKQGVCHPAKTHWHALSATASPVDTHTHTWRHARTQRQTNNTHTHIRHAHTQTHTHTQPAHMHARTHGCTHAPPPPHTHARTYKRREMDTYSPAQTPQRLGSHDGRRW